MRGTQIVDVAVIAFAVGVGFTFGEQAATNIIRRYEEARA
jgi:hypothetical protein